MRHVRRLEVAPIRRQAGVNLIEVLISMFVLAVGILGVVSLQSVSIQEGIQSQYNARAQMITDDLIDRIYANNSGASAGDYAGTFDGSAEDAATDCAAAVCSDDQMADYDMRQVASRMDADLKIPDGSFSLTFDAVASEYALALTWNAIGDDYDSAAPPECDDDTDNSNAGCMYTVVRVR